jgi:endoglucanase
VQAISTWKSNAVRVPMNEDCWLSINGVPTKNAGAAYQQSIADYVTVLNQQGQIAILELHWSAAGTQLAKGQSPMPDRDHSIAFWTQVAQRFQANSSVIFELFNEPFPDSNSDTDEAWRCWRDGGTCAGANYQVAGMQELVTAVRGTGATNVILLGGVEYSNRLGRWLSHKPSDPTGNLAAAWHIYNFNGCVDVGCYDREAGPVAAQVPIVATEIGEDDCGGGFIKPLMGWLDMHGQSYLGWVWDTWGGCLVLVGDYAGKPAGVYGQTFKDHLATVAP